MLCERIVIFDCNQSVHSHLNALHCPLFSTAGSLWAGWLVASRPIVPPHPSNDHLSLSRRLHSKFLVLARSLSLSVGYGMSWSEDTRCWWIRRAFPSPTYVTSSWLGVHFRDSTTNKYWWRLRNSKYRCPTRVQEHNRLYTKLRHRGQEQKGPQNT